MDRPVMHPSFTHEQLPPAPSRRKPLRAALVNLWRACKALVGVLFSSPTSLILGKGRHFRNDDGTPVTRFIKGLLYRAAFLPLFTAIIVAAFVYLGTHPMLTASLTDPQTHGIFFEPVSYTTARGVEVKSWIVPVLDAKRVLEEKNRVFRNNYPAVVLVHDHTATREQMMPLIRPLHEKGMIVMAAGLRGDPDSKGSGKAMGLTEVEDVKAAIDVLRSRPFVDPERVAVLGVGTGATAAALATAQDATIDAVILVDIPSDAGTVLGRYVVPNHSSLRWMLPLSKWGMEMMYGVDAEDMEVARIDQSLAGRQVLKVQSDACVGVNMNTVEQSVAYLTKKLANGPTTSAKQQVANSR
jgi:hypothetical protein